LSLPTCLSVIGRRLREVNGHDLPVAVFPEDHSSEPLMLGDAWRPLLIDVIDPCVGGLIRHVRWWLLHLRHPPIPSSSSFL
jgi:hypothetical protein